LNFSSVDRGLTVNAGGGADVISGGLGADTITAGAGADTITGGAGNDVISGGGDADDITGGTGGDALTGGAGIDRFRFTTGDSTIGALDTVSDFRAATGDNAAAVDVIELAGTDWLIGTNSTVQDLSAQASLGAALNAAANSNAVSNGLSVFTFGGSTYFYAEVTGGNTTAGASDFVARIDGTPFAASAALASLTAGTSTGLVGTFGADTLTGGGAADVISGGEGNDRLSGLADADNLSGGAGDDTLTGGAGADTITLGTGSDTVVFDTAATNGVDVISTFTAGVLNAGGDVFNMANLLTAGTLKSATALTIDQATTEATTQGVNEQVILVKVADLATVDTAAEIVTALANTGVADAVDVAASSKAVIIFSVDGSTAAIVVHINNDATAAVVEAEVNILATVTTSTDFIDTLTPANFVFA
jgi:Ca2+-binding RTX toxin-like protein